MPDYIGLYYPLIHFPHDSWIKLAALYWDKLGRIVPADYPLNDSDTVQKLQEELGFVENFTPNENDTARVASEFCKLLDQYSDKLKRYYSALSQGSNLGYIYAKDKTAEPLARRLLQMGLAVHMTASRKYSRFYRLEMHPKLVSVYMEALSVQMASTRGLQPVTHNMQDHVLMGEYTLERLVQALLEADDGQPHLVGSSPTPQETEKLMAAIALQSVLPQDVANVPIVKIIQLRQKHRAELTAFQTYIHDFTANLDTIQQIDDPRAINAHLETAYQRELKPLLDDLKKCLKSLAIET